MADGGNGGRRQGSVVIQPADIAIFGRGSVVKYGESIASDPQLGPTLDRERYFLNKLIPRHENIMSNLRMSCSTWNLQDTFVVIFVLAVFGTSAGLCSQTDDSALSYCADFSFKDYTSAILNVLATFLLAFYCNVATNEYSHVYQQCQLARQRTIDLVTLAAGTMDGGPRAQQLQMDIWRSANLMHLAAYTLSDKASAFEEPIKRGGTHDPKRIYSIDSFVIPVASAYGSTDTDAGGWRGMLREQELEHLSSFVERDDSTKANQLSNSRGDVRSRASFIDSAFSVRLIRLAEYAIEQKLTTAAWPVWGAAIRNHREATSALFRRALPRVRTLYRECVGLVVTLALVADALTLGPKVGLIVANRMPNAWVVATFAGVFLASVVLTVRVLISFCQNLERPIGSDPTDLPVLSYVMAAAEISLKQIRQQSDKMRDAYQLFTGAREFHGAPQPAAARGMASADELLKRRSESMGSQGADDGDE